MITADLENIVQEQREKGMPGAYIMNALKEYLQVHVLYFIYTSPQYKKNLIFTGGTCLRHFYGLERLSEDVDFNVIGSWDAPLLSHGLKDYFTSKLKYRDMSASVKAQGQQVLLKFPVLKGLGLARAGESDLLHVRMDASPLPSRHYSVVVASQSSFGINYAAVHYDLPSLMAGKLHAILTRRYFKGLENRATLKGRDYFDLLWFVKQGVQPNLKRLSDMLGERLSLGELEKRVDEKVARFIGDHKGDFEVEMKRLLRNPALISVFVDHYDEEYGRYKIQSFSQTIRLLVQCRNCGKEFASGISMGRETYATIELADNAHACPFCKYVNKVQKADYRVR